MAEPKAKQEATLEAKLEAKQQQEEEDMRWIAEELLPEMVHDRCFCGPKSREFVELASTQIQPHENYLAATGLGLECSQYRVAAVIRYSGEPEIVRLLVKVLPEVVDEHEPAFRGFLNEEIVFNKVTLSYGRDLFPKCYAADMGKYGRPVVVVEDLERKGWTRVLDRQFNYAEASLIIELVASIHAKGLRVRRDSFPTFREFYTKLQDIGSGSRSPIYSERPYYQCIRSRENLLEDYECCTLCQGLMIKENLWFLRDEEDDPPEKVLALDWQQVVLGPGCDDLTLILLHSDAAVRDELRDLYIDIVQREVPELTREQLLPEDPAS